MEEIRAYLLSVLSAVIISSILLRLTGKNGRLAAVMKCICGIYMLITMCEPFLNFDFSKAYIPQYFHEEAKLAVEEGRSYAEQEMKRYIAEKTASCILEKGKTLGADITVDVIVDALTPSAVMISGALSPFAKKELSAWIAENLGISPEAQQWT